MIERTITLIKEKHKGQFRKVSKEPFYTHPLAVMDILKDYTQQEKPLVVALLHDILEDTDMNEYQMAEIYGWDITNEVIRLTNDPKEIERIGKCEHIKNKFDKMTDIALMIKLCDILSNLLDNPTVKYINRNRELIDYLEKTKKLTKNQKSIIVKIKDMFKQNEN